MHKEAPFTDLKNKHYALSEGMVSQNESTIIYEWQNKNKVQ